MVWLPQLDWEVREPGKERDSKGHRRLSPAPPTHTPHLGSEGGASPSSEPELSREENGRDSLLTLHLGGELYEEVQSWGRSPPS